MGRWEGGKGWGGVGGYSRPLIISHRNKAGFKKPLVSACLKNILQAEAGVLIRQQ